VNPPCHQCGKCCAAFTVISVTEAEADWLGREFCERDENSRWSLRLVERRWSPIPMIPCCVFLMPSLRCAIHDAKPAVCSKWQCQENPALMAYAVANIEANQTHTEENWRRRKIAYNEYSEEYHRVTTPARRLADFTYRSPFERARYDGTDPRYFQDVESNGYPAVAGAEA
jgi:Fe-S-cluster containining protein